MRVNAVIRRCMCDDYYYNQPKYIHTKYTTVVIIALLNLIWLLDCWTQFSSLHSEG